MPLTIALSPLLFQREITQNGVIFKKRNKKKLSAQFYVCSRSGQALFESQRRQALEICQRADDARQAQTERRRSLVANFVGAANPVSAAVETLVAVGSDAAAVSPINVDGTRQQARCSDAVLSATAITVAGALTETLSGPSGVTTDDAPVNALAILSERRAAAEKHVADRLRDSARALRTFSGSIRLYVSLFRLLACLLQLLCLHFFGPLGSHVWVLLDFGAS